MAHVALHYYRYVPSDVIISKSSGGNFIIPTGWHNLNTVLARLRAGSGGITATWNAVSNRCSYSVAILVPAGIVRELLGHGATTSTNGTSQPKYTWVPEGAEYMQELSPFNGPGKRSFDFDHHVSQSGQVGGLGVIDVYTERFRFNLVKKQDIFTLVDAGLSSPLNSVVFRPDLGLVFELKVGETAESISSGAGYTLGLSWCHVDDIDIAMQMPPWDLYFTVAFEANRYIP